MKIVYLHQYFTTPKMSGITRSYEMAKRLVQAGHEVHIVTTWRGRTDRTGWWLEEVDGIQVHWLPVAYSNNMGYRARINAFVRFAFSSGRKATTIGGDLIFATSTPLTIALPGVYAARRLRKPLVFEVRDLWPEIPIAINALRNPLVIAMARWLERFAYRNSDRIIALSPGMADGVVATGYPREKVCVIPNSCDLDIFSPDRAGAERFRAAHPELGNGPIVLYAGTFGRINGVSYLAELADRLRDQCPEVRFVAIGAGLEVDGVRARARELGVLGVNFFMYPAIPKLDLVDAFRAAAVSTSLFIDLPEMWHNSANKFFDTLASGTAVAINYSGWQADLIREHDIGLILGVDPNEGAEKLVQLLKNPARMNEMGKHAHQLAINVFSRDILGRKFVDVIEDAARQHSEGARNPRNPFSGKC